MNKKFQLMSTRYSNSGINTISDVEIFKCKTIVKNKKQNKIYHLRSDYNKSTSAWSNMTYFLDNVITKINSPFVLLITGEDFTIPNQLDIRWQNKEHLDLIKKTYNTIINHPFLLNCYIENRDENHPKTSSLPLGCNPREMINNNIDYLLKYIDNNPPIKNRELKTICIHRERPGDREIINKIKHNWKNLIIDNVSVKHDEWYKLMQKYPFIICAHGGGIDPCPKIWEALCVGCIPIIKHSPLDDIYKEFPVVFVDKWDKDTININNLKKWIKTYSKFYDNKELQKKWKPKLYAEYWENKIKSHFIK